MSKEAFPNLPPNAQANIERFPPKLHDTAQEQLLRLSHNSLITSGEFDDVAIPRGELGEEHQPHIDTVSRQMGGASSALSMAQLELLSTGLEADQLGFEMLGDKAKEISIRQAVEAKQAGDIVAAVSSLESLLVIDALGGIDSGYRQSMQSKQIAREITAAGLATELVKATHQTFGLVAMSRRATVPLNTIAKSSPELLRAATSLQFTDDFSEIAPADTLHDTSDLRAGELLALAKMEENVHSDIGAAKVLLKEALVPGKLGVVEPDVLLEILSKSRELSLQPEVDTALARLRVKRRSGDTAYRFNDMNTGLLDETIVKSVQNGEVEFAKALMSSSPAELDHLKRAVERGAADPATLRQLTTTLEGLWSNKQAELRRELQERGVDESTTRWIIENAADPDSAAEISSDFWKSHPDSHSLADLFVRGGDDLAKTAGALSAIERAGLAEHAGLLLQKVLRIDDESIADSYLASARVAFDSLAGQNDPEAGRKIDLQSLLANLSEFEDPVAALEASNALFGPENGQGQVRTLYELVRPQFGTKELATFRPDDITALATIRNYCVSTGLGPEHLSAVAPSLLRESDPAGRAQRVSEGLRLANVTGENDSLLFFEISRCSDPVSVGRAVSELEPVLAGTDKGFRDNVLSLATNSENPEQTSQQILRCQQELQRYQLTIKEIGEQHLLDLIRIVHGDKDGSSLEKFVSKWKIERDTTEAFIKYLEPVRISGSARSANAELRPKLADIPAIVSQFERLGISSELAERMADSWLSLSAISRRLYGDGNMRSEVTPQDILISSGEQARELAKQAEALADYVERFGIEETTELANTFGICNFIRYNPEQLHNQMISWRSGERPARNIVVSALADWNGAVSDAGKSFERVLSEEGLYCFEVSDKVELAKVAVAVGNRERAAGQNPEETNSIKNFIIDGHANPYGILLGTRGQALDAVDYTKDPLNGKRANTYKRHLGSNFRVILKACSTAGEVEYGKNIAEAISDHHDVRVEGSKVNTRGAIIIEADGSVRFNSGEVLSTVYE